MVCEPNDRCLSFCSQTSRYRNPSPFHTDSTEKGGGEGFIETQPFRQPPTYRVAPYRDPLYTMGLHTGTPLLMEYIVSISRKAGYKFRNFSPKESHRVSVLTKLCQKVALPLKLCPGQKSFPIWMEKQLMKISRVSLSVTCGESQRQTLRITHNFWAITHSSTPEVKSL